MTTARSETPLTDKMLQAFRVVSPDGEVLNDKFTSTQKRIMEVFFRRRSPEGHKRVHIMCHTRFGKSQSVAVPIAIRAAVNRERWAIVAPTKEKAQIIMDYVITVLLGDPILSRLVVGVKGKVDAEHLRQRERQSHLRFVDGGEIRIFHAEEVMGFGAPNVVMDEAALITDEQEEKIVRMLGDNPTNFFLAKIGNPFHKNHFFRSFEDPNYYKINADWRVGLREGRISEEILNEQRGKPNFGVLYENTFPDDESADPYGWRTLISHATLRRALERGESAEQAGFPVVGLDPAEDGLCEAVAVARWSMVARVLTAQATSKPGLFAEEVVRRAPPDTQGFVCDKVGVGAGAAERLAQITERSVGISGAERPDSTMLRVGEEATAFANLRALLFWRVKQWLEDGGALVPDERWKQLLSLRYKINQRGAIVVISKEELRKRHNIHDIGAADALSYTFYQLAPRWEAKVLGGVAPYDPTFGV